MNNIRYNLNPTNLFIIAGLGNPGDEYKKTRHNAGFLFLDFLANKLNESWQENKKLKCDFIKSGNLLLIKPTSYMNNSGQSIEAVMNYYKMLDKKFGLKKKNADYSEKLLVVHDEIDIDFPKYKVSLNSRSAGHNGVQSIINHLKSKNFARLRIGIKNEILDHMSGKDFVLKRFSGDDLDKFQELNKEMFNKFFG
ncbi:aminoacyl-tRNA hydrolase [Candidatus Parcubacteria bacterium]|nr:MAG: aminoacyl-tRNA hydrolase [Candidatus Parcubacteria bacterium]